MTDDEDNTSRSPEALTDSPTQPRRRRAPIIAGLVGAAVLALVALFVVSPQVGDDQPPSPLVGKLAPPLAGATLTGETFDIDSARGKWVLVNFFATWCPPCIVEHPELVELSEVDPDRLEVVSVAFADTTENVSQFFAERGGTWPVLASDTGRIAIDYGVKGLPESYLIGPSGTIVAKFIGGITADGLLEYLQGPG